MFWGVFLVLLGLSMILDHVFGISFPLFRILAALLIISLGIKILFGSFSHKWVFKKVKTDREAIFSKSDFRLTSPTSSLDKATYNTVFGESVLDLRDTPDLQSFDKTIHLNVAFGGMHVIVPKELSFTVEASTAFGNIEALGDSVSFFGSTTFRSPQKDAPNPLRIKANVAFGNLSIGTDPRSTEER